MTWANNVLRLALAIKVAEGSNPLWNNPGDMVFADGFPTHGFANSEGVLLFNNAEDGWNALCHQCNLMLTGKSHVYTLDMTIAQVGLKYANGDTNWAKNVALELGVSLGTTLADLAGANP
jgi:hypothetical protein